MLLAIGQVAVQDVGDRAEQQVVDREALGRGRARVHPSKVPGGVPASETPECAGRGQAPRHQARHSVYGLDLVHLAEMGEQLHRVVVVDERIVTDPAQ